MKDTYLEYKAAGFTARSASAVRAKLGRRKSGVYSAKKHPQGTTINMHYFVPHIEWLLCVKGFRSAGGHNPVFTANTMERSNS